VAFLEKNFDDCNVEKMTIAEQFELRKRNFGRKNRLCAVHLLQHVLESRKPVAFKMQKVLSVLSTGFQMTD
jgi:hypothetical protein